MSATLFEETGDNELLTEIVKLGLAPGEILLGTLSSIDATGNPVVSFTFINDAISAVAIPTIAVTHQHLGRQVALLFANGDYQKPVIMGFIYSPLQQLLENFSLQQHTESDHPADQTVFDGAVAQIEKINSTVETLHVDGKRVVIEGQEEIVLQCGDASITLTKAGKIIIRGKYLLSRSTGVNRILGGSVQVN